MSSEQDRRLIEDYLPSEAVSGEASREESIRMTTNEWYKAAQLGDSYWLYPVWDPLANPYPEPLKICNPVKHLDHAKREVVRYVDIPADAIESAARSAREHRYERAGARATMDANMIWFRKQVPPNRGWFQ